MELLGLPYGKGQYRRKQRWKDTVLMSSSESLGPAEPKAYIDSSFIWFTKHPFCDLSQLELVYVTPNQRSLAQHSPHLIIRQLVDPKEIEKDQETGLESGKNIYRKNWVGIMST